MTRSADGYLIIIILIVGIVSITLALTSLSASANQQSFNPDINFQSQPPKILTPILERYPNLSATQAADLYFRITGSNAPGFSFGTNKGTGFIPQYDNSNKLVSIKNNPVNIAYNDYLSHQTSSSLPNYIQPNQIPTSISFISILQFLGARL